MTSQNDELAFLTLDQRGAVVMMRAGYMIETNDEGSTLWQPYSAADIERPRIPIEAEAVEALAEWGALVRNTTLRIHELHPVWASTSEFPRCTHCMRPAPATILACPYCDRPERVADVPEVEDVGVGVGFDLSDESRTALAALRETERDILGDRSDPVASGNAAAWLLAELARDQISQSSGVPRHLIERISISGDAPEVVGDDHRDEVQNAE